MQKYSLTLFLFFYLCFFSLPACKWLTPSQIAKTVIDIATATCVIEHGWRSEKEIVAFCNISQELLPEIRKMLVAQKIAAKQAASTICNDQNE